jgi:hypothetical protein
MVAHTIVDWVGQLPNPAPVEPPGSARILGVVSNVKWAAGVSLIVGFLTGLIVWAGGRWIDHHRAGRIGIVMMLCSIGGAILYGIGWTLINGFSQG